MVDEGKLSAVLSDFARTLATDFPIQRILDHLVGRIVEILPITAAGVTLISGGNAPQYIAASDESAMRFERLQTELRDGPCMWAYQRGEAISVPDLSGRRALPALRPLGGREWSRRRLHLSPSRWHWPPRRARPLPRRAGRTGSARHGGRADAGRRCGRLPAERTSKRRQPDNLRAVSSRRTARSIDGVAKPAAAAATVGARRTTSAALAHQRCRAFRRP